MLYADGTPTAPDFLARCLASIAEPSTSPFSAEMPQSPRETGKKHIAIAIDLGFAFPWHYEPYQGIKNYAAEQGWSIAVDPHLVGVTGNFDLSRYDGIVGRINNETAQVAHENGIEVVAINTAHGIEELPGVRIDADAAARMAAEHLIQSGYQRVEMVGVAGGGFNEKYFVGLREAVIEHGMPEPTMIEVPNDFDVGSGSTAYAKKCMTEWVLQLTLPVAVVVRSIITSRYLAEIVQELGLRVPEDVGILVFEGDELVASSCSPTISAIKFDFVQLGYDAASLLHDLMENRATEPLQRAIRPRQVIVRESTDVFLCDDPLVTDAMRYIAEHASENVSVERLTEELDVSRRTLYRRFEQMLGRTVYQEICRLRIDHIKRLIANSNMPMERLARDCGFNSASHFTRFFRKETGTTPGVYRRECLQNASRQGKVSASNE